MTTTHSGIRSNTPLDDAAIQGIVPAIYADRPHADVSDRYAYLPTSEFVDALRTEGLGVYSAEQSRSRDPQRREFTRHIVRMRMPATAAQQARGEYNELALLSSHDRSTALILRADRFRQVCSNGLVLGGTFEQIRLRHSGGIFIKDVIDAAYRIVDTFTQIDATCEEMASIELTEAERIDLAGKAIQLRWNSERPAPVSTRSVLVPANYEERPTTLWSTFNIIQRNLVGGGLMTTQKNGRQRKAQAIRAIDSNTRLNRGLWNLAEELRLTHA